MLHLGESSVSTPKYLLVVKALKSYMNSLPGQRYLEKPFSQPNPAWYRLGIFHTAQQSTLKSLLHFFSQILSHRLPHCWVCSLLASSDLVSPSDASLIFVPRPHITPTPHANRFISDYGKFSPLKLKNVCPPPCPHHLIKNLLCDPSSLEGRGKVANNSLYLLGLSWPHLDPRCTCLLQHLLWGLSCRKLILESTILLDSLNNNNRILVFLMTCVILKSSADI